LAGSWRVTVREGASVSHSTFSSLEEALDEIETRGQELARSARAKPVDTKLFGRWEPQQQVAGRLQLGRRGGVDIRGDGSSEAYTGWLRRRLVEQRADESAYEALRRQLAGPSSSTTS
jgi:hypothetical protein